VIFTNSEYGDVFGNELATYVATADPNYFEKSNDD